VVSMAVSSTHALRPLRLLLAAALVALLTLSLASAVSATDAHAAKSKSHKSHRKSHRQKHKRHRTKKRRAHKASVPLTGIYDSCQVSSPQPKRALPDCADRLTALSQGGFDVVLNYANGGSTIDDAVAYAQQAEQVGIKVIWNLATYHNLNTGQNVPVGPKLDLVRATMDLPATWGYYIGDEHPEDRPLVADVSSAVRNITNLPLLYVSRPNPSKLEPFKGLADYLGPDSYPVGPFDKPTCDTARWASRMVPNNLTMVLQAYSWSIDYPNLNPQWPSAGEMRQQRNQAMRCGDPKLLLWFCFHCVTDYNPNPDSYYRQLAWAANGVNLSSSYRISSLGS
jgi:Ni/Co efflux regulator RcnB